MRRWEDVLEFFVVLIQTVLAAIFIVAAISKLADLPRFRVTLNEFGAPQLLSSQLAIGFPIAEFTIGLLLSFGTTSWWGGIAAIALLCIFSIVIGLNLIAGNRPSCNCFGQLRESPIGATTLARNAILISGALLVVTYQGNRAAGVGLLEVSGELIGKYPQTTLAVAIILNLTMFLIGGWLSYQLIRQQGRLVLRIDNLDLRLTAAGILPLPDVATYKGLALGSEAPGFSLGRLEGGETSLNDLKSLGEKIILVFSDVACEPCQAFVPRLERLASAHAKDFTTVLVTKGTVREVQEKLNGSVLPHVLIQNGAHPAEQYGATATPSAIVINRFGLIDSALALGAGQIEQLIAEIGSDQNSESQQINAIELSRNRVDAIVS